MLRKSFTFVIALFSLLLLIGAQSSGSASTQACSINSYFGIGTVKTVQVAISGSVVDGKVSGTLNVNFLNLTNFSGSLSGLSFVTAKDGTVTISGTVTKGYYYIGRYSYASVDFVLSQAPGANAKLVSLTTYATDKTGVRLSVLYTFLTQDWISGKYAVSLQ